MVPFILLPMMEIIVTTTWIFCEKQCYENSNGYYDEATIHVSLAIINLLRQINGEERYCTYYPEVYNNCNGDCEKYVIEFEDKEFCD